MDKYNQLVSYIKLHKISLEQDSEKLSKKMDKMDWGSKAYEDVEVEDISLNGQMAGLQHILRYIEELDEIGYERV